MEEGGETEKMWQPLCPCSSGLNLWVAREGFAEQQIIMSHREPCCHKKVAPLPPAALLLFWLPKGCTIDCTPDCTPLYFTVRSNDALASDVQIVLYVTHWAACGFFWEACHSGFDPGVLVGADASFFASLSTTNQ